MIAVSLDPLVVQVAVAGSGAAALRRFRILQAGGGGAVRLFLEPSLPNRSELANLHALWIAGLPDERAAELAALARSERVLVNVEDRPSLCDFHSVAEVRRGDLLLTVSTGGASPGLAARIRERLAAEYGPEWSERLAALREHRAAWRRSGYDLAAETDVLLQANGWLA